MERFRVGGDQKVWINSPGEVFPGSFSEATVEKDETDTPTCITLRSTIAFTFPIDPKTTLVQLTHRPAKPNQDNDKYRPECEVRDTKKINYHPGTINNEKPATIKDMFPEFSQERINELRERPSTKINSDQCFSEKGPHPTPDGPLVALCINMLNNSISEHLLTALLCIITNENSGVSFIYYRDPDGIIRRELYRSNEITIDYQ